MQNEIWKDVINFENYFKISNKGRVFSKRTHKIVKQTKLKSGYLVVNTRIGGRKGTAYSLRVHRLVAEAFLESPSQELLSEMNSWVYKKIPVNHIDGNKDNNTADNLEWCSYAENSRHAVDNGLFIAKKGTEVSTSNLTEDDVRAIREVYIPFHREFGTRALAKVYGVHHTTISKAILRVSYRDIA